MVMGALEDPVVWGASLKTEWIHIRLKAAGDGRRLSGTGACISASQLHMIKMINPKP